MQPLGFWLNHRCDLPLVSGRSNLDEAQKDELFAEVEKHEDSKEEAAKCIKNCWATDKKPPFFWEVCMGFGVGELKTGCGIGILGPLGDRLEDV